MRQTQHERKGQSSSTQKKNRDFFSFTLIFYFFFSSNNRSKIQNQQNHSFTKMMQVEQPQQQNAMTEHGQMQEDSDMVEVRSY